MKIGTLLTVFLAVYVVLFSSCIITSRQINVDISTEEFKQNPSGIINDFKAEIGDKITVKLASNPSTGFQWTYKITGDPAIKQEDRDFEEPRGDAAGAAGKDIWTFEAVENGASEVAMEYSQPWDGGIKKQWTYSFTVLVE